MKTVLAPGVAWPPFTPPVRVRAMTNPAILAYREKRIASGASTRVYNYLLANPWAYVADISTALEMKDTQISSLTSSLKLMQRLVVRYGDRKVHGRRLKQYACAIPIMQKEMQ